MFLDEVHDLKDRFPERLQIVHVLSRESQGVELLSGRLDGPRLRRILDALLPAREVDDWFLCGPQQMVEEPARGHSRGRQGNPDGSTASCSTPTPPRGRRSPRWPGSGGPRTSRSCSTGAAPTSSCDRTTYPSWRRRSGSVRTCRSPARAGVRDLPGQGRRGQRRDGRQLRTRAGRGGTGLRAHLPVAPHRRAGGPRLRRVATDR